MSTTYDEITLKNAVDVGNAERGHIKESDIRQTTIRVIADTGADTLIINETIREALGLRIRGPAEAWLANGANEGCSNQRFAVTEPVEVHWKDRYMTCQPWLLPNAQEVLLGAIPLEEMDITVDCVGQGPGQRLIGVHGDKQVRHIR